MHTPKQIHRESSDKIVVFVHGFMGTPYQFEDLMKATYEDDFSVASILLPGHGATGLEFAKCTLKAWEEHLHSELTKLSEYKKIYLVGHSIGGLLALNATESFNISGVVALSTPLKIYFFNPLANYKKVKLTFKMVDEKIKDCYKNSNSIASPYNRTIPLWGRVLLQPHKLMRKTRKNLKNISVPTLIVHSKSDETVAIKSSLLFDRLMTNAPHETVVLEESWHAYYTESERATVLNKILSFINKTSTKR